MKTTHTASLRIGLGLVAWGIFSIAALADDSNAPDLDGDGIPNIVDPDIDNDGIPNAVDPNVDGGIALAGPYAGKYIGDHLNNENPAENDIDGDDLYDDSLGENDIDGDTDADKSQYELDIDGDGRSDDAAVELDIDGDGRADDKLSEDDIDGDGLDDSDDQNEFDIDGDGIEDSLDDDIDGDGKLNSSSDDDDTDGDGLHNDDPDEDNDDGDRYSDRDDDDDDNDGIRDNDDDDHHNEEDEQEVYIALTRQPAAPAESKVEIELQRMATGTTEFEVEAEKLPAGNYQIVVDGIERGILAITGSETEGKVKFETNPDDDDELPLDFDVAGLPVEIRKDGVVYFLGTAPTIPVYAGELEEEDSASNGGSPLLAGIAPTDITGLALVFDDGDSQDTLTFSDSSSGSESSSEKTDVSGFSYTYEVTSETTATVTVTFKPDKWDTYTIDFQTSSYIVNEYRDSALDKTDAGTVSKV